MINTPSQFQPQFTRL